MTKLFNPLEHSAFCDGWNAAMNKCKNGGECGVGGYCEDCYQPIDELNLLRTQVRDLRQQRDDALKTEQEPVMYWGDGQPLYLHPAPVVSSEPVEKMYQVIGMSVLKDQKYQDGYFIAEGDEDRICEMFFKRLRYHFAPPSRHLSDEEILEMWFAECQRPNEVRTSDLVISFARALLLEANR